MSISGALVVGFVRGRSILGPSYNYRSVVVFGVATPVTDESEKRAALEAITAHFLPGRWDELREPTESEWAQTRLLRIPLNEASAKIRTGPPIEETEEDYELGAWAGVVPLRIAAGEPIPDPRLDPTIGLTADVAMLVDRYQ